MPDRVNTVYEVAEEMLRGSKPSEMLRETSENSQGVDGHITNEIDLRHAPKRFQVFGWVTPTAKPKESDGVQHFIGEYDFLAVAEAVRLESFRVGWGRIEIREL